MSKRRKHSTRNRSPRPKINQAELYSVLTDYLPDEEIKEVCTKLTKSNQLITPDSLKARAKHIIEGYFKDNRAIYDLNEEDSTLFYHTTLFGPGNIAIPLNIIVDFDMNTIGFMAALQEVPEEYLLLTCDLLNKINNENIYGTFAIDSDENFIYFSLYYLFIPENLNREEFELYAVKTMENIEEYYPAFDEMVKGNFEISNKEMLKDSIKSLLTILKK